MSVLESALRAGIGSLRGSIPIRAVLALVCVFALSCTQNSDAYDCRTDLTGNSLGISTGSGLNTLDDTDLDSYFATVAESGSEWVRFDFDWSHIEPQRGRFRWETNDRLVRAANEHGLRILGLITHTPEWSRSALAPSDDEHGMPSDPEEFGRFAGDVARRYNQVVTHWEIWNEPNLTAFFLPRPDVDTYAQMLVSATQHIGNADPAATVVSGGLAPATNNGSDIEPGTFLTGLYELGVSSSFDVVGMHPYSYPALPSDSSTSRWNSFYRLRDLREIMVDNGDVDKAVWATEFGSPTGTGEGAVDPDTQAEILRDAVTEQRALGFVEKLFVYSLVDRGTDLSDREQNFGIIEHDRSPKPAWDVLHTATITPGCL